jgi:hypothetical protein
MVCRVLLLGGIFAPVAGGPIRVHERERMDGGQCLCLCLCLRFVG